MSESEQETRGYHNIPEPIDIGEVRRITGRSKTSIYDDPTFPQPISYTEPGRVVRHSRWLKHEVVKWLLEKIAQRDAKVEARTQELIARQERKRQKQSAAPSRTQHVEALDHPTLRAKRTTRANVARSSLLRKPGASLAGGGDLGSDGMARSAASSASATPLQQSPKPDMEVDR